MLLKPVFSGFVLLFCSSHFSCWTETLLLYFYMVECNRMFWLLHGANSGLIFNPIIISIQILLYSEIQICFANLGDMLNTLRPSTTIGIPCFKSAGHPMPIRLPFYRPATPTRTWSWWPRRDRSVVVVVGEELLHIDGVPLRSAGRHFSSLFSIHFTSLISLFRRLVGSLTFALENSRTLQLVLLMWL